MDNARSVDQTMSESRYDALTDSNAIRAKLVVQFDRLTILRKMVNSQLRDIKQALECEGYKIENDAGVIVDRFMRGE